jgi:excisionase family DNA binding protein
MPTTPTATARPPRIEELRPVGLPILDAARYLGVSRWTVQRLRASGEVEGYHIGAAAMIAVDSLDAYVARQRAAAARDGGRPGDNS